MRDIVWVSLQGHRSVSVSRHFLLQAPQCPCSVRKRFSRDHCCRGRSKPGCRIVGSHTRWELTTWADFQLCLHRLLMSTGCKSSHNGYDILIAYNDDWTAGCCGGVTTTQEVSQIQRWCNGSSRWPFVRCLISLNVAFRTVQQQSNQFVCNCNSQ